MKFALFAILLLLAWGFWRAWHTGPMPQIGERAPEFSLPDQDGQLHKPADYAGRWLVLYFYPKDDTPGCTREACAFRDGLARLQASGAAVVGVSVDTQESHARFAGKYGLSFKLLADSDGTVARAYGVLMDWRLYRMARRVTFLISPAGEIHQVFQGIDPDRHADEILAALTRAAQ